MTAERTDSFDSFGALAALCAAGTCDDAERAQLEALADGDPELSELCREFSDAGAALALALPPIPPPAGALIGIREQIVGDRAQSATGPTRPLTALAADRERVTTDVRRADIIDLAERRRRRAVVASMVSVAAAAAMALLWVSERGSSSDLRDELFVARQQAELAAASAQRTRQELTAARAETVSLETRLDDAARRAEIRTAVVTGSDTPTVKIAIDPTERRWRVQAFNLPAPGAEQDYQFWFLPLNGAPVPSDVLTVRADGTLSAEVAMPAALTMDELSGAAISIEPKGGSPTGAPTTVRMLGQLI